MDRQIRALLTMSYSINENIYKRNKENEPEKVNFIMQKGYNTALICKNGTNNVAHTNQLRASQNYKKVQSKATLNDYVDEQESRAEESMDDQISSEDSKYETLGS